MIACDLAFVGQGVTLGLPEAANGLFPFLALAIVRDALPKKVFFDMVYNARLFGAHEACALHLANKVVAREMVVIEAVAEIERTKHIHPDVLALGRDLYYATGGLSRAEALDMSRFALGSALGASRKITD